MLAPGLRRMHEPVKHDRRLAQTPPHWGDLGSCKSNAPTQSCDLKLWYTPCLTVKLRAQSLVQSPCWMQAKRSCSSTNSISLRFHRWGGRTCCIRRPENCAALASSRACCYPFERSASQLGPLSHVRLTSTAEGGRISRRQSRRSRPSCEPMGRLAYRPASKCQLVAGSNTKRPCQRCPKGSTQRWPADAPQHRLRPLSIHHDSDINCALACLCTRLTATWRTGRLLHRRARQRTERITVQEQGMCRAASTCMYGALLAVPPWVARLISCV
jgi:hypothetical protein